MNLEDNMAIVTVGYTNIFLSIDDAAQLLRLMKQASFVRSEYKDGKYVWNKHEGSDITVLIATPEIQAQILMSGGA